MRGPASDGADWLGIPVNNVDFSYLSRCYKPNCLFTAATTSWEYCQGAGIRGLLPGDNRFVEVKGVDPFFAGKLNELDAAVTDWMLERHPELRP